MVGDSMARDVDGAMAAGLRAIWLNRGSAGTPGRAGVDEITTLTELAAAID